jgi:hypothetical protein
MYKNREYLEKWTIDDKTTKKTIDGEERDREDDRGRVG